MNKVKHPFWVIVHKEIADQCTQSAFYHSDKHYCIDLHGGFVYGSYQYRCSNKAR